MVGILRLMAEIRRSPVDMVNIPLFIGFQHHPRWCKISAINSSFLFGWPIFRGELLVSGRVGIALMFFYRVTPNKKVRRVEGKKLPKKMICEIVMKLQVLRGEER